MPSKILLCLLCIALLAACRKQVEQAAPEDEVKSTLTSWDAFRLVPGGINTTIQFENGKQLRALQKDSSYYVDGDIRLAPWQIEQLKKINSPASRAFISAFMHSWPAGRVHYVINEGFSPNDRNIILQAIADWQSNTSLKFIPRTWQNSVAYPDYIEFAPSWGNSSNLGRVGGQQFVFLYVDPYYGVHLTAVTHEIGHAIGFLHEHARADRNNFIAVNWSNIQPSVQHNFLSWAEQSIPGTDLGTFDFSSIMLYPSFVTDLNFVFNTSLPVMHRLDGTTWGWNFRLSQGDVESAEFIYGPPFARLEYENIANNNSWTWMLITEYSKDDVYVRLYADEQCTVPFYTLTEKKVELQFTESIYGDTYNATRVFSVPAGRYEVLIHPSMVRRDYRVEWGATITNESRKYLPQNAFFRN